MPDEVQEAMAEINAKVVRKIDRELLYDFLISHLGTAYRWGGDNPLQGYDCSGFMVEILKAFGICGRGFDTTAYGLLSRLRDFPCEASLGAMVFFGKSDREISHVGMGINTWQMIEAGGGGSSTTTLEIASAQDACIRLRPIYARKDRVFTAWPFSTSF